MLLILVDLVQKVYNTRNYLETDYNAKIIEIEEKLPSVTALANTSALNAVKNKIPNVTDLAKKPNCEAKISDIETKYFTTSDYNKFTDKTLDVKI